MKRLITLTILLLTLSVGASWGIHGSSLKFAVVGGTASTVQMSSPIFQTNKSKSISVWAWSDSSGVARTFLGSESANWYAALDGGRLYVSYIDSTTGSQQTPYLSGVTKLNTWNHLVITARTVASDSVILIGYINGDSVGQFVSTNGWSKVVFGVNWYVGSLYTNSYWFTGYIDEFQYYRGRVISPTEVKWLYNHPGAVYSTDSLQYWFKFNEYTGTAAGDSSGKGNPSGTISGATWNIETPVYAAKMGHGSSLLFDAATVGKYVYFNGTVDDIFQSNKSKSISVWTYQFTDTSYPVLLGCGSQNYYFTTHLGKIYCSYVDSVFGTQFAFNLSATPLRLNMWNHLVVTVKTVASDSVIWTGYVNGDSTGSLIMSTGWQAVVGTDWMSGSFSAIGNSPLNGFGDNFQYYKRVLTKSEVKWLYNHPDAAINNSSADSLKMWLKFNEFTGDTCYDASGNNNYGLRGNGVAANKPTWSIETP